MFEVPTQQPGQYPNLKQATDVPNLNSLLDRTIEHMHIILDRASIIERATIGLPPQLGIQQGSAPQPQAVPSSVLERLNNLTALQNLVIHTLSRVSEAL